MSISKFARTTSPLLAALLALTSTSEARKAQSPTRTMSERLAELETSSTKPAAERTPAPAQSILAPAQRAADGAHEAALPAPIPRSTMTPSFDDLRFDERGDGVIWAKGKGWKAAFDGEGATIVPFMGSDAPRNFPLVMRASTATLGGGALDVRSPDAAVREGNVVRIDRGAFVEEYVLEKERMEQRFVFHTLPRLGDLVVSIEVDGELAGQDLGTRLRFSNERGHVDYGEAFALDAAGARLPLDSTFVDGDIRLAVPAEFVAGATLPITIDPFVTFWTIGNGSTNQTDGDVAYDVTSDRWCTVYASVFSATDTDAYAELYGSAGNYIGISTIDFSSDHWVTPKIANNNGNNCFLVVCAVVPSSGVANIAGRIVTAATGAVGSVIQISPLDGAYRNWPDVGGDPFPSQNSSYFCVVWQRYVSQFDNNIEARMVRPDGTFGGPFFSLESSTDQHEFPRISNSLGFDSGDTTARWTVAWHQRYNDHDYDIWAAQIGWSGTVHAPMFPVNTSTKDDRHPVPSSVLDPVGAGVDRPALIVFERDEGDHDIVGAVVRGSSVLVTQNLVGAMPPAYFYYDQIRAAVDSDGSQFLVGFVERFSPTSYDANVWISNHYWTGTTLAACASHENFAGSGQAEFDVQLHSKASSAGSRQRYFATWTFQTGAGDYDVQGGLWDGCGGGTITPMCAGDGSGTACPCGNSGAAGNGCASSVSASGAHLAGSGNASVTADTLVITGSGMPATATCLYFQGTADVAAGAGAVFGDGLRCAGGTVIRLASKTNAGGASQYPGGGDPSISVKGAIPTEGGTRIYQAWYRNAGAFCTSSTFNLTNGLRVAWAH
jgi:hypothetical protein